MSELVESLERVVEPVWYLGVSVLPSNGRYIVLGEVVNTLEEATLLIKNAYSALQGSLVEDEN